MLNHNKLFKSVRIFDSSFIYTFKTGEWFQNNKQSSFFPEVPVIFSVDGNLEHYHIPLLISPYGYSTYRGN
ncbi:MAG: hydroxyisourate hydrolase [Acinetobacter sp.]